MNRMFVESGFVSLNKFGEQLCGDKVETINTDDDFIIVLADGLGSGVKANILSTLTSKIIGTMMASGLPIEECVSTIAQTLPVCQTRGVAYSTFTILQIRRGNEAYLVQFDNPNVIFLRNGHATEYEMNQKIICGKKIYETHIDCELGDMFILMSDGVVHAGIERTLNYGWQLPEITEFAVGNYEPDMSAHTMASRIGEACKGLYMDKPGDDTTVAVLRIRKRQLVNLIIGPPVDPEDDETVMQLFFSKEGKRIVCGGTTSNVVSRYLDKPIKTELNYEDPSIPPIGHIEGVDLVTEGVLTLGKVLEIAEGFSNNSDFYTQFRDKKDGASLIAQMLFEDATDINFFVGRAKNAAHQNPNMPLNFSLKLKLIEELSRRLEEMGKTIKVMYF
ncbi:MAG: SpoIIE family protein phosphatase [Clostridia bacterium]|nr:SpoIIE family protein phosphatase [Clostridia bacterium]